MTLNHIKQKNISLKWHEAYSNQDKGKWTQAKCLTCYIFVPASFLMVLLCP